MTTPTERDGADHDGAPYLPDAQPVSAGPAQPTTPTDPDAPFVPAPAPVAAPPVEPTPFDAKAMVESQKNYRAAPAYGALPTGSEANREAAQQLRAKARRKRRLNLLFGRALAVVLVGGLVAAGWFGYQAYQDQQDRDAAERAAAAAEAADEDSGAESAIAALTPLGEQQEIVEAMGDLNNTARSSAGGLLGAIDDARDLTQVLPPKTIEGPFSPEPLPPPRVARRPDYRSITYYVRQYDGAATGATFRDFDVTYDTERDSYYGVAHDSASGDTSLVSFDEAWRYSIGPDGVSRRVRRSALSLEPGPDTPLAGMLGEFDVFPRTARPFATLLVESASDEIGVDGTPVTHYSYFLDVAGFRAADPDSYLEWRSLWATASGAHIDLIEPGTEQVQLAEAMDAGPLQQRTVEDLSEYEFEPFDNETAIVFGITERGIVEMASVISPQEDLRVVYVMGGYSDESARLEFGEGTWVDAP